MKARRTTGLVLVLVAAVCSCAAMKMSLSHRTVNTRRLQSDMMLAFAPEFVVLLAMVLSLGLGAATAISVESLPAKGSKTYLMLETADVGSDIVTFWLTRDAGDLEFANDPLGLVKTFLLISVVLSCATYIVELAFRCSTGISKFRDRMPYLQSFHFACEDVFQATLYALTAAAEASQGGAANRATYGALAVIQAMFFIVARLVDMYPSRNITKSAASAFV
eukprot:COSAG03_NODE_7096_length_963_cov_1.592593_1_plen_220_part_10